MGYMAPTPHKENIVLNCASVEYFKVIDRPSLDLNVITPQFKDMKNGKYKMISYKNVAVSDKLKSNMHKKGIA